MYAKAVKLIPGGVNSPVRAFKSVNRNPVFIDRGEGSQIVDIDGNSYIDYVMSYGPLIFGHAPAEIVTAIESVAKNGTSFGASTPREVQFAELLVSLMPSLERVRLVNSGTEAVMSAVRVARGFTGRDKIIKFAGHYHGHSDGLLSHAGSGIATFDLPGSAGIPHNLTRDTITVPYNDMGAVKNVLDAFPDEIAGVLLEPVAANMGVVPPAPGFLADLRDETLKRSMLLIFDEVITGFRLSPGGAQELYGVRPDLTCLGKIIGGGLPLAAFGGRADVMDMVAPLGSVYQAGTLSGNPLAVAAGLEVLKKVRANPKMYSELNSKMEWLTQSFDASATKFHVPHKINRMGSLSTFFFTEETVVDFATAKTSDTVVYSAFFNHALNAGVYFAPSQFEAAFMSTVHSHDDLVETANVVDAALASIRN
jgi:glutamate-1-semialdehyde 2,1-aminomutase